MHDHDAADQYVAPADVAADLKRTLRRLTYATVALFLVTISLIVWVFTIVDDNRRAGGQAIQALCELRQGIDERIDASVAFLRKHPNGIQGISRLEILAGIARDRVSRRRLEAVECPRN